MDMCLDPSASICSAIAPRPSLLRNNGQWAIDPSSTPQRVGSMGRICHTNLSMQSSAVVINGHVVSAPIMQPTQSVPTSFQGQIQISGGFTQYQARAIAAEL